MMTASRGESSAHPRPLLALETSGGSLGVALFGSGGLLFDENVIEGMVHGRALVPLMKKALTSQNLMAADLCGVAVSQGPGSWTGLRIGIAAAKAFAWAAGIPLVCVPSFEALALSARHAGSEFVLTLRDARSEGFFAAIFDVTQAAPKRLLDDSVMRIADVVEAVQRLGKIRLTVCGDGKCLAALAAEITANGWISLPDLEHIPARAVAECGWRRFHAGMGVAQNPSEIHKIGPLYLRASDPELKLKNKPQT